MHFFVPSPRSLALVFLIWLNSTAASTPSGFEPAVSKDLRMEYADDSSVRPGTSLSEKLTVDVPTLYRPSGESKDAEYAAIMVDYDVDVYGTEMTILQWYQPSLSSLDDDDKLLVSDAVAPNASYISPAPIPGPAHEYVVLLYVQPAGFSLPECLQKSALPEANRAGFNLQQFAQVAGLKEPVAGEGQLAPLGASPGHGDLVAKRRVVGQLEEVPRDQHRWTQ